MRQSGVSDFDINEPQGSEVGQVFQMHQSGVAEIVRKAKGFEVIPPLLVYFLILQNHDVELTHVEIFEEY